MARKEGTSLEGKLQALPSRRNNGRAKMAKRNKAVFVELDSREVATVLAALRLWQEHDRFSMIRRFPHFEEVSPLDGAEIDSLCERINFGGLDKLDRAVASTKKKAISEYCPICDEPIYVGDRVSNLSDGTMTHPNCKLKKGVRR